VRATQTTPCPLCYSPGLVWEAHRWKAGGRLLCACGLKLPLTAVFSMEGVRQGLAMALQAHGVSGCTGPVGFKEQRGGLGVDGLYVECRNCGHLALALS
jgi:hypothetical protein